ncbi:MAG TPA: hypothetical protein VFN68_07355 [Acidimicrobiales bacterium]|nr:hypothetical protein [Acidimicrobiales bacterium]
MVAALLSSAFVYAETSRPASPSNQVGWDTLFVAGGLLLFVLVVAAAAALANSKEDRRHSG